MLRKALRLWKILLKIIFIAANIKRKKSKVRPHSLQRPGFRSGSVAVGCKRAVSGDTEPGQGQRVGKGDGMRGLGLSEVVRLPQQAPEAGRALAGGERRSSWVKGGSLRSLGLSNR